jgi:hypothetical protein
VDGPAEFQGLYTEGSTVLSCCWIAPHATLLVRKHARANTLVAGFRVIDAPRFDGGQRVTIGFVGNPAPAQRSKRLDRGNQYTIKVPVPANLRAATGLIPVTIDSAVDYVPARDTRAVRTLFTILHLRAAPSSGDERHLGIVLLYLYFQ